MEGFYARAVLGWLKKNIKLEWKLAFFSAVIIGFFNTLIYICKPIAEP